MPFEVSTEDGRLCAGDARTGHGAVVKGWHGWYNLEAEFSEIRFHLSPTKASSHSGTPPSASERNLHPYYFAAYFGTIRFSGPSHRPGYVLRDPTRNHAHMNLCPNGGVCWLDPARVPDVNAKLLEWETDINAMSQSNRACTFGPDAKFTDSPTGYKGRGKMYVHLFGISTFAVALSRVAQDAVSRVGQGVCPINPTPMSASYYHVTVDRGDPAVWNKSWRRVYGQHLDVVYEFL